MKNVSVEVDDDLIVVTIDTKGERWRPSSGSSNKMVASTQGNQPVVVGEEVFYIGLNCYTK